MIQLTRTNSDNPDFIALVALLDAYLAVKDGDDHAFYAQFNKIDALKQVIVAYDGDVAVACGAIKEHGTGEIEVKRMFTKDSHRGKGIASQVLNELELWAKDLNYKKCVLETGKRQLEAVQLYLKNNYRIIPNYGQYIGVKDSVCFEKDLNI